MSSIRNTILRIERSWALMENPAHTLAMARVAWPEITHDLLMQRAGGAMKERDIADWLFGKGLYEKEPRTMTQHPKPPMLRWCRIAHDGNIVRMAFEKDQEIRRSKRAAIWASSAKLGGDIVGWDHIVNFGPAPTPWRFW